ncbi:MAG: hypothetical protein ACYTBJ_02490 [Planctomycetota bacterium]|jgi:hypothetical protein
MKVDLLGLADAVDEIRGSATGYKGMTLWLAADCIRQTETLEQFIESEQAMLAWECSLQHDGGSYGNWDEDDILEGFKYYQEDLRDAAAIELHCEGNARHPDWWLSD